MEQDLKSAVHALQGEHQDNAQRGLAALIKMTRRSPRECATEVSSAVLAELAAGALRTPDLLTALGLTRIPVPDCVPVCLDVLRALGATQTPAPALAPPTALIGAAAIVARTQPRTLLPDLEGMEADARAGQGVDHGLAHALMPLLSITSGFLKELPSSPLTDMARWLWCDCAALDLMTLADVVGMYIENSGADDEIVALILDLVERVPATADAKRYAGRRLQQAEIGSAAVEQLKNAWRAISVAPAPNVTGLGSFVVNDPEPPEPDPRVDEWLTIFAEADEHAIEYARVVIDEMFDGLHPPMALGWWVGVMVDGLPPRRRREEVRWALVQLGTALRKHGDRMSTVSPSVLQSWLDLPQFLDPTDTQIALYILGRQQPGIVVRRYLHRAVAASSLEHADIVMGEMWHELAAADPLEILLVASRWITIDFGHCALLDLLLQAVIEHVRSNPALIEAIDEHLLPTPNTSAGAIDIARKLLVELRNLPTEG